MTPPRTILVVGATGQQGGFVLSELSNQLKNTPDAQVKVLALTRSVASPKAQALRSKYPALDLSVVEGDTRAPEPIFAAYPDIDAIFSFTLPPDEEPQATALIDAAAKRATSGPDAKPIHFVFSSVDRGGEPKSWDTPTEIPHFIQKHNVEIYLRAAAEASGGKLTYTILRPVAFMDNLNPGGTFGMVFASLWNTLPSTRKLQLVGVRDIGLFGAQALLSSSDTFFRNRAVGLAGDELTLGEARDIYRRVAASSNSNRSNSGSISSSSSSNIAPAELPQAWTVVGWGVRTLVARHVGAMFRWFETDGYGVDVGALRAREPRLQSFEAWLRESSAFEFGGGEARGEKS